MIEPTATASACGNFWRPGWRFPNGDLRIVEDSDHEDFAAAMNRAHEIMSVAYIRADFETEIPGLILEPQPEVPTLDPALDTHGTLRAAEVPGWEYYGVREADYFPDRLEVISEPPALAPAPLLEGDLGTDRQDLIADGLSLLVALCHTRSVTAGWWHDPKTGEPRGSVAEKLCLIHSEISEAMEGDRKGLRDDKLRHRWAVEVELADALIRIADLAGALRCSGVHLDLGGAVLEKLAYNAQRADHQIENRKSAGGKAY